MRRQNSWQCYCSTWYLCTVSNRSQASHLAFDLHPWWAQFTTSAFLLSPGCPDHEWPLPYFPGRTADDPHRGLCAHLSECMVPSLGRHYGKLGSTAILCKMLKEREKKVQEDLDCFCVNEDGQEESYWVDIAKWEEDRLHHVAHVFEHGHASCGFTEWSSADCSQGREDCTEQGLCTANSSRVGDTRYLCLGRRRDMGTSKHLHLTTTC